MRGLILISLTLLCTLTSAQTVLKRMANVRLTAYYDNSIARGQPDVCATTHGWPVGWQTAVLGDWGLCGGRSYRSLGNDRMVALGASLNPIAYCGNHIRLIDPTGKIFQLDGQNFYVKDTCPGCGEDTLDISGWAMRKMYGGICGVQPVPGAINVPTGWTVEILDTIEPGAELNNQAIPDTAPPLPPPVPAPIPSVPAPGPAPPVVPTPGLPSLPVQPAPALPIPPVTAGSCVCNAKGAEGCVDGRRAICNSASGVDQTALKWDVVGGACLVRCARRRTWGDVMV